MTLPAELFVDSKCAPKHVVCRNHVDVEVDPLEFSTRQNHSDREAESALCAFPFERAWSANLEGEPVAEVEGS